jgi:hypothetical protein
MYDVLVKALVTTQAGMQATHTHAYTQTQGGGGVWGRGMDVKKLGKNVLGFIISTSNEYQEH